MSQRKVLIVDDHPIVCFGLAQLINESGDLVACGNAADEPAALKAIETLAPDVAIVDLSLNGRSGLDLIKTVRERFAALPILVVSMHDENIYAERALRAGARGYIMKQEAAEKVVAGLRRVLSGEVFLSESVASRLLTRLSGADPAQLGSPVEQLSDRELEVFQMIGQGLSTRLIAEKLFLSVKTIETYREHIKEKLGLKTAAELVQRAVQHAQNIENV